MNEPSNLIRRRDSTTADKPRVGAVVVLYRPSPAVVEHATAAVAQCRRVVVVPNSTPGTVESALVELGCEVLPYEGNGGIARGFNRGIRALLGGPTAENSPDYVLLLDQDSRAPEGMTAALVAASIDGNAAGLRVAAVGPVLRDVKDHSGAKRPSATSPALVAVESLASSGTLVHRDVLDNVGLLDEALFIDAVDHEWCLRAASRGLSSYVVSTVSLAHNMGDRLVRVGGRGRPLHHNPVRHYYIIRNSLLLLRRPYLPRTWRAQEFARTVRRVVGYTVLSENRGRSVRYIARALADAARNRSGPIDGE